MNLDMSLQMITPLEYFFTNITFIILNWWLLLWSPIINKIINLGKSINMYVDKYHKNIDRTKIEPNFNVFFPKNIFKWYS